MKESSTAIITHRYLKLVKRGISMAEAERISFNGAVANNVNVSLVYCEPGKKDICKVFRPDGMVEDTIKCLTYKYTRQNGLSDETVKLAKEGIHIGKFRPVYGIK